MSKTHTDHVVVTLGPNGETLYNGKPASDPNKVTEGVKHLTGSLGRLGRKSFGLGKSAVKPVTTVASTTKVVAGAKVEQARNIHTAKKAMKGQMAEIGAQIRKSKEEQS